MHSTSYKSLGGLLNCKTIAIKKLFMKTILKSPFGKLGLVLILVFSSQLVSAQVTYTDSVCAGSTDVVYGVTGAAATSHYSWYLSDPTAGTIDSTVSANNGTIEIDWGTTAGSYTLFVVENDQYGCYSDTVSLGIVINPLPTVAIVADSICEGFSSNLTFTFTGTAPWIVDYNDGTTNYTDTANASPYVVSLPPYNTSQTVTVTGLSDGNSCAADPASLPNTPVIVNPKPSTGAIFHY